VIISDDALPNKKIIIRRKKTLLPEKQTVFNSAR